MQETLKRAPAALPGIFFEPTPFSLAGSVGWRLEAIFAQGPSGAFIRNTREFAHQHRPQDGSMHNQGISQEIFRTTSIESYRFSSN